MNLTSLFFTLRTKTPAKAGSKEITYFGSEIKEKPIQLRYSLIAQVILVIYIFLY